MIKDESGPAKTNKPEWPAFAAPHSPELSIGDGSNGLSCREYAAIHLRIPDSGTEWLDEMIRKANKPGPPSTSLAGEMFDKICMGDIVYRSDGKKFFTVPMEFWDKFDALIKASGERGE